MESPTLVRAAEGLGESGSYVHGSLAGGSFGGHILACLTQYGSHSRVGSPAHDSHPSLQVMPC